MNDARSLLASMATIATGGAGTTVDQEQEEAAKAEEAMWSWYLEWSQIARVAISQRALLKQMGFGATPHPKAPAPVVVAPGTGNGVDPHAPPVPVTAPATPH